MRQRLTQGLQPVLQEPQLLPQFVLQEPQLLPQFVLQELQPLPQFALQEPQVFVQCVPQSSFLQPQPRVLLQPEPYRLPP